MFLKVTTKNLPILNKLATIISKTGILDYQVYVIILSVSALPLDVLTIVVEF